MSGNNCCRRQDLLGEASPHSSQHLTATPHEGSTGVPHKQNEQQAGALGLTRRNLPWSAEEEAPSQNLLTEKGPGIPLKLGVCSLQAVCTTSHKASKLMKPSLNNLRKPPDLTLILIGDYNFPDICWKGNMAGHKQLRRFLRVSEITC